MGLIGEVCPNQSKFTENKRAMALKEKNYLFNENI